MRAWMGTVATAAAGGALTTALLLASGHAADARRGRRRATRRWRRAASSWRAPRPAGALSARRDLRARRARRGGACARASCPPSARRSARREPPARDHRGLRLRDRRRAGPRRLQRPHGRRGHGHHGQARRRPHGAGARARAATTTPTWRSSPSTRTGSACASSSSAEGAARGGGRPDPRARQARGGAPDAGHGRRVRRPAGGSWPTAASRVDGAIQTDAPQVPGDTGGPLLDAAGRVIGATAAPDGGGAVVGFAVPADTIAQVVPALEDVGRVRRAFLGVRAEAGGRRRARGRGARGLAGRGGRRTARRHAAAPRRRARALASTTSSRVLAGREPGERWRSSSPAGRRRSTRARAARRPAGRHRRPLSGAGPAARARRRADRQGERTRLPRVTRVKICGTTRMEDAELAVDLGAWALGFILWPGSSRAADPAWRPGSPPRCAAGWSSWASSSTRRWTRSRTRPTPCTSRTSSSTATRGPSFCAEAGRRSGCRVIKADPRRLGAPTCRTPQRFHTDFHLLDTAAPRAARRLGERLGLGARRAPARRRARHPLRRPDGGDGRGRDRRRAARTRSTSPRASRPRPGVKDPDGSPPSSRRPRRLRRPPGGPGPAREARRRAARLPS